MQSNLETFLSPNGSKIDAKLVYRDAIACASMACDPQGSILTRSYWQRECQKLDLETIVYFGAYNVK